MGVLKNRFWLGRPPSTTTLGGGQFLRDNPFPNIEVVWPILSGLVSNRELRDLHQARFNRVNQSKFADYPRKGSAGLPANAAEVVGSGGEIETEVDAAELVNTVQSFHPHSRFLEELVLFIALKEAFIAALVAANAVGVVGLVVHYENILLGTNVTSDDTFHECGIALDIAFTLNRYAEERTCFVTLLLQDLKRTACLQCLKRRGSHIARATRGGRLRGYVYGLLRRDSHASFYNPRADAAGIHLVGFKEMPVVY